MSGLDVVYSRWRSIEGQPYSTGGDRFNPPGLDCSGAVVFANRTVVPWLQSGNTASMAREAIRQGITKPLGARRPGDLVIYDKYGVATASDGPRGHMGQVSRDLNVTWEAASSRGTQQYSYSRLRWAMCVDMSRWLGGSGLPRPGWVPPNMEPTQEQIEAFWRLLAELHRQRIRRLFPMWLIRDNRPGSGATYLFNGVTARYLNDETLKVQEALMKDLGVSTSIYKDQQYLIDRLAEQGQLIR